MSALLGPLLLLATAQSPAGTPQSECVDPKALTPAAKAKLPVQRWEASSWTRLLEAIYALGAGSRGYDRCARPLAVLQFDRVVIPGSLSEAALSTALSSGFVTAADILRTISDEDRAELSGALDPESDGAVRTEVADRLERGYGARCAKQGMLDCRRWLARLFAGRTARDLAVFAALVLERAGQAAAPRPEVTRLVTALQRTGWDVHVVSTLPEWLVRPAAARLGLPPAQVIGLQAISDPAGKTTGQIAAPIPIDAGAVDAVRTRIAPGGRRPAIVLGATEAARALLDAADRLAVLFDTLDPALARYAQAKRWAIQPPFERR